MIKISQNGLVATVRVEISILVCWCENGCIPMHWEILYLAFHHLKSPFHHLKLSLHHLPSADAVWSVYFQRIIKTVATKRAIDSASWTQLKNTQFWSMQENWTSEKWICKQQGRWQLNVNVCATSRCMPTILLAGQHHINRFSPILPKPISPNHQSPNRILRNHIVTPNNKSIEI